MGTTATAVSRVLGTTAGIFGGAAIAHLIAPALTYWQWVLIALALMVVTHVLRGRN